MPSRLWTDSKSATVDGTGRGSVRFSHPGYGRLHADTIQRSSTSALIPPCIAYRSVEEPGSIVGNTLDGTSGQFIGTPADVFWPGESILVVWTGATVGATVTATLTGTIDLGH